MSAQGLELWVVAFEPFQERCGIGGFQWFWEQEDAREFYDEFVRDNPYDSRVMLLRRDTEAVKGDITYGMDGVEFWETREEYVIASHTPVTNEEAVQIIEQQYVGGRNERSDALGIVLSLARETLQARAVA